MTNEVRIETKDSKGRHWRITVDVCDYPNWYVSEAYATVGGYSTDTEVLPVDGKTARKYLPHLSDLIIDEMYAEMERELL